MSVRRSPPKQLPSDPNLENTELTSYNSDSQLDCITKRRVKRKMECEQSDNSTMAQLKILFHQFEQQQNSKLEQLILSVNTVKDQNSEIHKSMEFISKQYDDFLVRMDCLERENVAYKKRIETLEYKIEDLERSSRSSTIELRNIPKQNPESKETLRNLVKKVGDVINQPITDTDINEIFRLKTKKESNNHIIVQLSSTNMKETVIRKCRYFNKENIQNKLNTTHLQISGTPQPIYIDESLTAKAKRLRYLVREFTKAHNYHSFWTSYGKVYMREKEGSPVIRVDCEEDLQKLDSK